ncbi:MAG TPA: M28 family peptidase [Thermoanaerobaculia bacterium]|nr:M28 family peptidase [Thermoanaerobaculia bacterium]
MSETGWKQLLAGDPWSAGPGRSPRYPIDAYSEFMPPPRLGRKPCGGVDPVLFAADDPWGWHVSEYEQAFELDPGLAHLATELLHGLRRLGRGESGHGISRKKLEKNPYWPDELLRTGAPAGERYVVLAPLALARTQDDKGRVRWTVFGGSEQGPSRGFWRGFWSAPGVERPAAEAFGFVQRLLLTAYGESALEPTSASLKSAGLRILAADSDGPLPSWTAPFLWRAGEPLDGVRWLLTFEPFAGLPEAVRRAYMGGALHLLPFPGSLVFWGTADYAELARELPLAGQIPLLHAFERCEAPRRLRVPQSGWLHEPREDRSAGQPAQPSDSEPQGTHGPFRNMFRRTHRWARVERFADELAVSGHEDKVAHVLFSTAADDLGLYGKPMARNSQLWTRDHRLLLDGPRAGREELAAAARQLRAGGLFGYRFQYPAMRVGRHEVYWHRPLAACIPDGGEPQTIAGAPLGYLTAYAEPVTDLAHPVELWPRLLVRPEHQAAIELLRSADGEGHPRTVINARKLLDAWELLGRRPLPPDFARVLLTLPGKESLAEWLDALPRQAADAGAGHLLATALRSRIALTGATDAKTDEPLTFHRTARRSFETAYWKEIARLSTGRFRNKDNADCVLDPPTQARLPHPARDLERLGEYLLDYYTRVIARYGLDPHTAVGDLPFRWRTAFDFAWSGGWLGNQEGQLEERDLLVRIPGRDRSRAVIMADHYDTAYMEDEYGYGHGGHGPRLAAAGADDNHSATVALMLAAPVFCELSQAGRLACDVWLVHLTGEEFPSDCMGARHLTERLVARDLRLRTRDGRFHDLSRTRVQGVYVLDMVAHNNDRRHNVFQICPGFGRESLWLAYQAHVAGRLWNAAAPAWNRRARRKRPGQRLPDPAGATVPPLALHPQLLGEVRPVQDPHSTLYNTDGQIFSDAGVPVVLFMENYDINRHGYHDSHDTMENIDLDYGAAVAAIAIESVARAATEPPPLPEEKETR